MQCLQCHTSDASCCNRKQNDAVPVILQGLHVSVTAQTGGTEHEAMEHEAVEHDMHRHHTKSHKQKANRKKTESKAPEKYAFQDCLA